MTINAYSRVSTRDQDLAIRPPALALLRPAASERKDVSKSRYKIAAQASESSSA